MVTWNRRLMGLVDAGCWTVKRQIRIRSLELRSQKQPPRRRHNGVVLTSYGDADILLLPNPTSLHARLLLSSDGKEKRRCAKSITKCQIEECFEVPRAAFWGWISNRERVKVKSSCVYAPCLQTRWKSGFARFYALVLERLYLVSTWRRHRNCILPELPWGLAVTFPRGIWDFRIVLS